MDINILDQKGKNFIYSTRKNIDILIMRIYYRKNNDKPFNNL
jgi:hypothetical protein